VSGEEDGVVVCRGALVMRRVSGRRGSAQHT
jgi:hypothetical protein